MKITKILAGTALVFSSAFASALTMQLPMFDGDYTSDDGFNSTNMTTAGYYLWNTTNTNEWHLRWTGIDADVNSRRVRWSGKLEFRHSNLDTFSEFRFDRRGDRPLEYVYDNPSLAGSDALAWSTRTNKSGGIDGIDFTLEEGAEILDFTLGSSLFNNLTDGTSSNIFIGDSMQATDMRAMTYNGMTYQNFGVGVTTASMGVAVPEPGSLLLLGVGLIGLGLSRRRCA